MARLLEETARDGGELGVCLRLKVRKAGRVCESDIESVRAGRKQARCRHWLSPFHRPLPCEACVAFILSVFSAL